MPLTQATSTEGTTLAKVESEQVNRTAAMSCLRFRNARGFAAVAFPWLVRWSGGGAPETGTCATCSDPLLAITSRTISLSIVPNACQCLARHTRMKPAAEQSHAAPGVAVKIPVLENRCRLPAAGTAVDDHQQRVNAPYCGVFGGPLLMNPKS